MEKLASRQIYENLADTKDPKSAKPYNGKLKEVSYSVTSPYLL